eukprot:946520_1
MPRIGHILLIMILFYVVFGVLGMQLFSGMFFQCEDVKSGELLPDFGVSDCASNGGVWRNPSFGNFDHIGAAMLLLFEVASMEMWPDVMYRAVDITEAGKAPIENNHNEYALFFVVFLVLGNFFIINLFVGAVCDTFSRIKDELTGFELLTAQQRMWVQVKTLLLHAKGSRRLVAPPKRGLIAPLRHTCFRVCSHPRFEWFIMVMIVANILTMAMWIDGTQATVYATVLDWVNGFFTFLFLAEALIKLTGLGLEQYLSSSWNIFDFVIVIISVGSFALEAQIGTKSFDFTVFRVFRILRIFRLVKRYAGLKRLVQTIIIALPSMANIGCLLLLLFFMYAVAGQQLFGKIENLDGDNLNVHANFGNFWFAVLTLYRIATGESWNGIMHDVTANLKCSMPACEQVYPLVYFLSFVILGQFMMLNLFIAIILENFEHVAEPHSAETITFDDIEAFSESWSVFGEKRSSWWKWWSSTDKWMRVERLENFLFSTHGSLGLADKEMKRVGVFQLVSSLSIPLHSRPTAADLSVHSDFVHFYETMLALAYVEFAHGRQEIVDIPRQCSANNFLDRKLRSQYKELTVADPPITKDADVADGSLKKRGNSPPAAQLDPRAARAVGFMAAVRIQAAFRGFRERHRLVATGVVAGDGPPEMSSDRNLRG